MVETTKETARRMSSREVVEDLARRTRGEMGDPTHFGIGRALSALGCTCVQSLGPQHPDGRPMRLAIAADGSSTLHLNTTSSLAYDTETMGVALYHLLLDRTMRTTTSGRRDVMAWAEATGDAQEHRDAIEALWFMQELLMPAESFCGIETSRAARMASRHGVTVRLATWRIETLAGRKAA